MEWFMPVVPPELGHRLLKAGAGAGKTTTLVATFIAFVKQFRADHQGEFPRIVVTTFTRKATQEVRERLMKKALESGENEIFNYLGEKSRVHISTIDGILSLFLSRYGERLGLPADFRFVSEEELKWISRRELRRVLSEEPSLTELLEVYDFAELWRALESWREKVMPQANAKIVSVDWFREKTLQKIRLLCAEAAELSAAIPNQTKNARLIEWGEVLGGLGPAPKTDEEIEAFLDRLTILDEAFGTKPSASLSDESMNERKKAFKDLWDPCADSAPQEMLRPSYWNRHQRRMELFETLAEKWVGRVEKIRRDQGLLSMSDLETLSLQLIRQDEEAALSFSKEWDYWMIDEYQDTSPVQVELLKYLVGDRPHFVVGDPQQSIYFFRGARSQVFFEKMEQFQKQNALVQSVVVNHRSRTPLLEFFNDFFRPRPAFSPMESKPKRTAFPPEHPAAELRIVEREDDRDVCVAAAIERIQELLAHPEIKPESICVLSRANEPLKSLQAEARVLGLPVQLHTAGGFAARREIRDVLAFLRFLLNPSDNLTFLTLLRSPWFSLEDVKILPYCKGPGSSFWQEAMKVETSADEHHPISRLKSFLKNSSFMGLAETLKLFYRQEGILDSAHFVDPTGRREANLWKILVQLENAQRSPGFNALAFVDSLDQRISTEEGNEDGDAVPAIEPKRVQLMTIHASKGLEFDHVIVLGLEKSLRSDRSNLLMVDEESGLWTLGEKDLSGSLKSSLLAKEILEKRNQLLSEESLRVLYVALTRAMQTVSLIWEKPRTKNGNPSASSWAAAVPFDLSDGEHDRGAYRYRVRTEAPRVKSLSQESRSVPALIEKWPMRESATHWAVMSPTQLLEERAALEEISAPRRADFATEGLKVAQRGTDAHRLFESLKYAPPEQVEEMTKDAELLEGLRWMLAEKSLPLLDLIRQGEVEWGFAAREGDFILQGQVDLWGIVDGTVWIVDYKTGSPKAFAKALDQMAIYAWALQNLGMIGADQPIRLIALYPLDKTLREKSYSKVSDLHADWTRLIPSRGPV
ncbi:MAG TPA: UvrD-helicase domain-containing protein [Pseudobdellovibrionaceae bacterium]|nr:UvrD-helicase domain-containing protein [Pseudobdellovibrionaceae bacterium]